MDFVKELMFLKEQLKFRGIFDVPRNIKNIAIAGMGGSGVAGKIFSEFYSDRPVSLIDDYALPKFLSKSTLAISISYSGNTEETINFTKYSKRKGAFCVTISSGGELSSYGDQHIRLPRSDLQPRSATGYMLMPLLSSFGILSNNEVKNSYKLLSSLDKDHSKCADEASRINHGEKIPVIYGASPFKSIAYRWKTQFNENSKIMAYSNSFPELNHNDTMAIYGTYRKNDLYFIAFGSTDAKIKRRIAVTSKITGTRFSLINPQGSTDIEKMFYLLHYGDYVSYHLGLLRKIDPTDVSLIEKLKREIKSTTIS